MKENYISFVSISEKLFFAEACRAKEQILEMGSFFTLYYATSLQWYLPFFIYSYFIPPSLKSANSWNRLCIYVLIYRFQKVQRQTSEVKESRSSIVRLKLPVLLTLLIATVTKILNHILKSGYFYEETVFCTEYKIIDLVIYEKREKRKRKIISPCVQILMYYFDRKIDANHEKYR